MGVKKTVGKAVALGAVISVAALLFKHMKKDGSIDTKKLSKTANTIRARVAKHARTVGELTKDAYNTIVDTTVAEYRGMKALSEGELGDLKKELLDSWTDVKAMAKEAAGKEVNTVKKTVAAKKAAVKKAVKKARRA